MATYRDQSSDSFSVGAIPPTITWTVVRGDTASFRVYVTDDNQDPLDMAEWTVDMSIVRPSIGELVIALTPIAEQGDSAGEFTVSLSYQQSELLETGDIFDIQMTDGVRIWTVGKGSMIMIEDVTG